MLDDSIGSTHVANCEAFCQASLIPCHWKGTSLLVSLKTYTGVNGELSKKLIKEKPIKSIVLHRTAIKPDVELISLHLMF